MPELVVFDLDGTLARSKEPLDSAMAVLLVQLLSRMKVAIVSGGALPQFLKQVVEQLPESAALQNLYLLPTSGAALFEYAGGDWKAVYEEKLSEGEAALIIAAIKEAARETGLMDVGAPSYGERIEYRGSEVTFSALGQQAPIAEKEAWDPDKTKRHALREALAAKLPGFEVAMGGSTSLDITNAGVDKAFGVKKLSEHLSLPLSAMLYVGDELGEGGNDAVVKKTGIETKAVANPQETQALIQSLLRQN